MLSAAGDGNCGDCGMNVHLLTCVVFRVRTATSKVITLLLRAGVDPNVKTKPNRLKRSDEGNTHHSTTQNVTPLHLILQRAMSLATEKYADDVSISDQQHSSYLDHTQQNTTYFDDSVTSVTNATGSAFPSKMRVSGRRVWVKAVNTLVEAGAEWNSSMIVLPGHTQLYMFLHSFPPPPSDADLYISLLRGALSTPGMNPLIEDNFGRSALFVLCEQMSKTAEDKCPKASKILSLVLQHIPNGGLGGSDRSGRTVFDLESTTVIGEFSCLQAAKQLLINAGTTRGGFINDNNFDDVNFQPPNVNQLRHEQWMMPADEYVVNGVERMKRDRF